MQTLPASEARQGQRWQPCFAHPGDHFGSPKRSSAVSVWQVFRLVSLPLARPGVVVAAILSFIFSWNNFIFAVVLAGRETRTLPVAVFSVLTFEQLAWGNLAAAALIVTLPVLIITVFVQRQIVVGMTAGATPSAGWRNGPGWNVSHRSRRKGRQPGGGCRPVRRACESDQVRRNGRVRSPVPRWAPERER
jgi:hypothetical protein